jgi:hypothetical protein
MLSILFHGFILIVFVVLFLFITLLAGVVVSINEAAAPGDIHEPRS